MSLRAFKNSKGLGLIEALIGASLIGIAGLSIGSAINSMAAARIKTQSVSAAVALESTVISVLQNPETYTPYTNLLLNGDINSFRNQFRLILSGWGSGEMPISNDPYFFEIDGSACTGGFGSKACAFSLKFDVREIASTPNYLYAFAYSINVNPDVTNMASLGSPGNNNFVASDYKIIVPAMLSKSQLISCVEPNAIAANGFNFDTGQLSCLQAPDDSDSCPAGEFAYALTVVANKIVFECRPLRIANCGGQFYSLNRLNPSILDPRSSVPALTDARCIFIGANSVNARTGASHGRLPLTGSITAAYGVTNGLFCPSGYNARIVSCTGFVAAVTSIPNRCPTGYPYSCPSLPSGAWFGASGNYDDPPVPPRNLGGTVSSVNGQRATCVLDNGNQPGLAWHRAGWTGYINMSVACDLNTSVWPVTVVGQCQGDGC